MAAPSAGVMCSDLGVFIGGDVFLEVFLLFKKFTLSNISRCPMFAILLEIEVLCYFRNMFVTNLLLEPHLIDSYLMCLTIFKPNFTKNVFHVLENMRFRKAGGNENRHYGFQSLRNLTQ